MTSMAYGKWFNLFQNTGTFFLGRPTFFLSSKRGDSPQTLTEGHRTGQKRYHAASTLVDSLQ